MASELSRTGSALRSVIERGTVAGSTERQLLARFVVARDELAFEAIVARHGPMVASVCRSVLTNSTDVDDAFQATFLVLVRKAGSLRDADHLSPWLHGVARRVALRARATTSKRRGRETLHSDLGSTAIDRSTPTAEERELAALLHAELERLAPPERSAVLLCDLQGLSHQEAADELGWPIGTVKSRVTRGRERLRARLTRRGVILPVGLIATALAHEATGAIVAPALVATTINLARGMMAARVVSLSMVPPSIDHLTQGTVRAMIIPKLKLAALSMMATTGVLAGPILFAFQGGPLRRPPGPAIVPSAPPTPVRMAPAQVRSVGESPTYQPELVTNLPAFSNPGEILPTMGQAGQTRVQMATVAVRAIDGVDPNGNPYPDELKFLWYRRLFDAELAAATTHEGRVRAAEGYTDRIEKFANERIERNLAQITSQLNNAAGPMANAPQNEDLWVASNHLTNTVGALKQWVQQNRRDPALPPPKGGDNQKPEIDKRSETLVQTLPADERRQRAILAKLETKLPMNFPSGDSSIALVFQHIAKQTIDEAAGLPDGIPIYPDAQAFQDADKTLASTIAIDLEGVPLRTSLHLALRQIGLSYVIKGGLMLIVPVGEDAAAKMPHPSWVVARNQPADEKLNAAIRAKLNEPLAMRFPNDTPLADIFRYLQQATIDETTGLTKGITIYADPQGIQDADMTMNSTVSINLDGIPLRTTLTLLLKQLNLTYVVEAGMIVVVAPRQILDAKVGPEPAPIGGGGFDGAFGGSGGGFR